MAFLCINDVGYLEWINTEKIVKIEVVEDAGDYAFRRWKVIFGFGCSCKDFVPFYTKEKALEFLNNILEEISSKQGGDRDVPK